VSIIPIIVGTLGSVPIDLSSYLGKLTIPDRCSNSSLDFSNDAYFQGLLNRKSTFINYRDL